MAIKLILESKALALVRPAKAKALDSKNVKIFMRTYLYHILKIVFYLKMAIKLILERREAKKL
jgi:hypothetical protein